MKIKNKRYYGTAAQLAQWKEEAEYFGRRTKLTKDCLIVFALPYSKKGKKKHGKEKHERNKRAEKFERRPDHSEQTRS